MFRHFDDRGAMYDRTSFMAVVGDGGDRPSRVAEQEIAFPANVGGRLNALKSPVPGLGGAWAPRWVYRRGRTGVPSDHLAVFRRSGSADRAPHMAAGRKGGDRPRAFPSREALCKSLCWYREKSGGLMLKPVPTQEFELTLLVICVVSHGPHSPFCHSRVPVARLSQTSV